MRRPEPRLVILVLAAVGALEPARAADPPAADRLGAVERDMDASRAEGTELTKQSTTLGAELAKLQAQAVAAARAAQANEARVTELEQALRELDADAGRQAAALAEGRRRELEIVSALEHLAQSPPATLLLSPGAPADQAHVGILLGSLVPRLQAEAQGLATGLARFRQTHDEIAAKTAELSQRQAVLEADHGRIAALMEEKQALQGTLKGKAEASRKRQAELAAEAKDLRQLADRVDRDAEPQAAPAEPAPEASSGNAPAPLHPAEDAARVKHPPAQIASLAPPHGKPLSQGGRLLAPVAGAVTRRFGEMDGYEPSKGLTFATRPGAQIVAPADGEIMFAGPFKGYGQILIIDHGGGYHSLLAGIDRIGGAVGQRVVAGEPVGTMPSEGAPSLYLELRRQGQPVNPLPWLAARDGKVSG